MTRYWYAGIPKKLAVQQVPGESFNYKPTKGLYNTDTEHPELKEWLEKVTEDEVTDKPRKPRRNR